MNQQEHHLHHHINTKQVSKALIATLAFMAIEFLGGFYTHSLALTSDAFHMLTDSMALGLTLLASYLMLKKKNPKIEIYAALANGIFLLGIAIFIFIEGLEHLKNPEIVKSKETLFIGLLGLIFNIVVLKFLSHSHAHNINMRGALFHVIGDLLGSVGVVISSIFYWLGYKAVDAMASIFIGVLIASSAFMPLKQVQSKFKSH